MRKSKTYRIVVIDPEARTITELQSDATLDTIHKLVSTNCLGHLKMAVHPGGGFDTGWVDDVGLSAAKPACVSAADWQGPAGRPLRDRRVRLPRRGR